MIEKKFKYANSQGFPCHRQDAVLHAVQLGLVSVRQMIDSWLTAVWYVRRRRKSWGHGVSEEDTAAAERFNDADEAPNDRRRVLAMPQ